MTEELRLNAFTGAPCEGSPLHPEFRRWVGVEIAAPALVLGGPAALVDPCLWKHPEVGWGLVLPDNPALSDTALATAADAPEPLRRLLAHREGVVLRWSPELPASKLRRYYENDTPLDSHIVMSERGKGRDRMPRYLLLYGAPEILPWELQYRLGAVAFTGRLDLTGDGLENYVNAVISNWGNAAASANRAVTWAVDHGDDDITSLMRTVIAKKVHNAFAGDNAMDPVFLDGRLAPATGALLIDTLVAKQPGMVVTTSHGMAGPLNDVSKMRAQMGLPVDSDFSVLDVETLLARWSPNGAIWYAHACCSAGSDAHSSYEGLLDQDSQADETLNAIAACGALVSPLPRRLLGAKRPLRAFLGQVEPTFDWTLKDNNTGQVLTHSIADALYRRLYQPFPIGYAFESVHNQAPKLEITRLAAKRGATQGLTQQAREESLREALTCRLVAQDLQSLVLLGDPAEVPWLD